MMLQVLIADFFFICVALAWLAAGVAEKSSLNSTVSTFASLYAWVCCASAMGHHAQAGRHAKLAFLLIFHAER